MNKESKKESIANFIDTDSMDHFIEDGVFKGYIFKSNIEGYDEIVIETPIWNGRISCPIQMVLSKVKLEGKKLTFILCSGSGKALKAVNYLKKRYNARIIEIQEPKKYKEYIEKLDGIENGN